MTPRDWGVTSAVVPGMLAYRVEELPHSAIFVWCASSSVYDY